MIGKVQRDVDDRNIGVDEHVLGDFDFLIGQVGHEVHARFLLEDLGKIIGAHVGVFADLLEGNVVLGVAVDVIENIVDGVFVFRTVFCHLVKNLIDGLHDLNFQIVAVLVALHKMLVAGTAAEGRNDVVITAVLGISLKDTSYFYQFAFMWSDIYKNNILFG